MSFTDPANPVSVDSLADSQTVIGFTEAELGLVLAVFFIVLWAISLRPAKPVSVPRPVVSADSAARLEAQIVMLRSELDSLRPNKSRMMPACTEKQVAPGPIFAVRVAGRDAYVVRGERQTWADILAISAEARKAADAAHCRQQIIVNPDAMASAAAYDAGLRRLRTTFYTILNGQ